ncbi:hypothetical protein HOG48_03260 [Candidatus Peregrinibacteria bacterium]|jgi:hypothetical protein|nr:hypothetical protein [Candidatus Peregrinibacteria bacterium]
MTPSFYQLGKVAVIKAKIEDLNKKYDHKVYNLRQEDETVYVFEVDTGDETESALLLEVNGELFPVSDEAYELVSVVLGY